MRAFVCKFNEGYGKTSTLVLGGNGQLGTAYSLKCKNFGSLCVAADFDNLNISDEEKVKQGFCFAPLFDHVFNATAFANVDMCDVNECQALKINTLGPKYLAENVARQGGTLLHVSTDYVFPGTDPTPRKETDPVCPINAYGRTKWAGEVFVRALCPKHFIVRTAWLYGLHGKNFVKTILKKARETGRISVVADQYGSPTFANDLAEALLQLAQTARYGTYHCTNAGVCSWFELASAAVDIAGIPCEKEAITTEEYRRRFPQSARRPMYSALDNTKIAGVLGKPLRPWREALEEFIDTLQKRRGSKCRKLSGWS